MVDVSWIDQKQAECDALRKRLADVEKERDTALDQLGKNRISTHSESCHTFGPRHYECLLRKYEASEAALKVAEELLQGGIEIAVAMHQNDPFEPIADNGLTVWDAILSDTARWDDRASVALAAIRKIKGGAA